MSSEDSAEEALEGEFFEDLGETIDDELSSDDASRPEAMDAVALYAAAVDDAYMDHSFLDDWLQARGSGAGDGDEQPKLKERIVRYWRDTVPKVSCRVPTEVHRSKLKLMLMVK